jgi:hypothetical protein
MRDEFILIKKPIGDRKNKLRTVVFLNTGVDVEAEE